MTLFLFWDIDGTLLTTARAGILAWEEAAQDAVGRPVDFSGLHTAGLTDPQIAREILAMLALDPTEQAVRRLVRRYEELLPLRLPRRVGGVLPGVREVLDALRDQADVVSLLLTGNTRAGAQSKLKHYGLAGYFDEGAFSDGARDRASIARTALALAQKRVGAPIGTGQIFVIGDTPHDIHCAAEIGARAVAVASGVYSMDELRRHNPWWVLERLPSPEVFLRTLRESDQTPPPEAC